MLYEKVRPIVEESKQNLFSKEGDDLESKNESLVLAENQFSQT